MIFRGNFWLIFNYAYFVNNYIILVWNFHIDCVSPLTRRPPLTPHGEGASGHRCVANTVSQEKSTPSPARRRRVEPFRGTSGIFVGSFTCAHLHVHTDSNQSTLVQTKITEESIPTRHPCSGASATMNRASAPSHPIYRLAFEASHLMPALSKNG